MDLFLSEYVNKKPNTYDEPINMLCAAKQGCFNLADYNRAIYQCYNDFAPNLGTFSPVIQFDQKSIVLWNSLEYNISEFLKEPCYSCKFFFLCSHRQCPFHNFDTYDVNEKYCLEYFASLKYFLDYIGSSFCKKT